MRNRKHNILPTSMFFLAGVRAWNDPRIFITSVTTVYFEYPTKTYRKFHRSLSMTLELLGNDLYFDSRNVHLRRRLRFIKYQQTMHTSSRFIRPVWAVTIIIINVRAINRFRTIRASERLFITSCCKPYRLFIAPFFVVRNAQERINR